MKKATITLRSGQTVTAYCEGGLAVHRSPNNKACWVVTHIGSGRSIDILLKTKKEAVKAADRLLELDVDWTRDEMEVMSQVEVISSVYGVQAGEYVRRIVIADLEDLSKPYSLTPSELQLRKRWLSRQA